MIQSSNIRVMSSALLKVAKILRKDFSELEKIQNSKQNVEKFVLKSIEKLKKTHNLGSGYPSDSTTVKFVKKYYKKNHSMPVFVRKSWKPVQKIMGKN